MQLKENISLKQYNTFCIDVNARFFSDVFTTEDINEILEDAYFKSIPKLILGGGSNILFTKDADDLVIHNRIKGIQVVQQHKDHIIIQAGAGELWNDVVMFCVEKNYGGIE